MSHQTPFSPPPGKDNDHQPNQSPNSLPPHPPVHSKPVNLSNSTTTTTTTPMEKPKLSVDVSSSSVMPNQSHETAVLGTTQNAPSPLRNHLKNMKINTQRRNKRSRSLSSLAHATGNRKQSIRFPLGNASPIHHRFMSGNSFTPTNASSPSATHQHAENLHQLQLLSHNFLANILLTRQQLRVSSGEYGGGTPTSASRTRETQVSQQQQLLRRHVYGKDRTESQPTDTSQQKPNEPMMHDGLSDTQLSGTFNEDESLEREEKQRLEQKLLLKRFMEQLLEHLKSADLQASLLTIKEALSKLKNGNREVILLASTHDSELSEIFSSIMDCWDQLWNMQNLQKPSSEQEMQSSLLQLNHSSLDEIYAHTQHKRLHLLAIAYFIMETDTLVEKYINVRKNDLRVLLELLAQRKKHNLASQEEEVSTTGPAQTRSDANPNSEYAVELFQHICDGCASMIEMDHHYFNRLLNRWYSLDHILKIVYIPTLMQHVSEAIAKADVVNFVDSFRIFVDFQKRILSVLHGYSEVHQSMPREVFQRTMSHEKPSSVGTPSSPSMHSARRRSSVKQSSGESSTGEGPPPRAFDAKSIANSQSSSPPYRPLKTRHFPSDDTFSNRGGKTDFSSLAEDIFDPIKSVFIAKIGSCSDSLREYLQDLGEECMEKERHQLQEFQYFDTVLSAKQEHPTRISRVCFDLFRELNFTFQQLCRPIFSDIHSSLFDTCKSIIQTYAWFIRDVLQKHMNISQPSTNDMNTLYIGCNILSYISDQCSVLQRFQTKQVMENTDSFNALAVKFSTLLRSFTLRIVQKHLFEIQKFILVDIESSDWQSFRVLLGESRCNYAVEMWYFYVRGVAHDVRNECLMTPMLASEIIGHTVAHSLKSFLLLYENIFPSRMRTKQFLCDISYIIHFARSFRLLTSASLMSNINRYCIYLAALGATLCAPLNSVSEFLQRSESEQVKRSSQFANTFELNQSQLVSIIPPNIWLPEPISNFTNLAGANSQQFDEDSYQEDILQIFDYHHSLNSKNEFHAAMWNANYNWESLLDACHFLGLTKNSKAMLFRLERRQEFDSDDYPELSDSEKEEANKLMEEIQYTKRDLSPAV